MIPLLKPFVDDWLARPSSPQPGPMTLTHRQILILPTTWGWYFVPLILVMLAGSVTYGLSLGFLLTFLVGSIAMVSALHAYRNLAQLRVMVGRAEPVFAGETARFPVYLENPSQQARFSVGLVRGGEELAFADVPRDGHVAIELRVPASRRGLLRAGRFALFTRYPIGLFYAWSPLELEASCLVYPRPDDAPLPPPVGRAGTGDATRSGVGDDDFTGLKSYQPGDSPRRVAWKASGRADELLTKQFTGQTADELWLDWTRLPAHLDVETRLSRLTGWVLKAERSGVRYGLQLPGRQFPPASGETQRLRCLEVLARFDAASIGP